MALPHRQPATLAGGKQATQVDRWHMPNDPRTPLYPLSPELKNKLGQPATVVATGDGVLPARFNGWVIGRGEMLAGGHDRKSAPRGTTVTVWLTVNGYILTGRHSWTQGHDGLDGEQYRSDFHATPGDALAWLKVDGKGKLGRASQDAWVQACQTVPQMAGMEVEREPDRTFTLDLNADLWAGLRARGHIVNPETDRPYFQVGAGLMFTVDGVAMSVGDARALLDGHTTLKQIADRRSPRAEAPIVPSVTFVRSGQDVPEPWRRIIEERLRRIICKERPSQEAWFVSTRQARDSGDWDLLFQRSGDDRTLCLTLKGMEADVDDPEFGPTVRRFLAGNWPMGSDYEKRRPDSEGDLYHWLVPYYRMASERADWATLTEGERVDEIRMVVEREVPGIHSRVLDLLGITGRWSRVLAELEVPEYAVLIDRRGHYQVVVANYSGPLRPGQAHGFKNGRYVATGITGVSDEPRRYRLFVEADAVFFPTLQRTPRPHPKVEQLFDEFEGLGSKVTRDSRQWIELGGTDVTSDRSSLRTWKGGEEKECPTCGSLAEMHKYGVAPDGSERARPHAGRFARIAVRKEWRCTNPACNYSEPVQD